MNIDSLLKSCPQRDCREGQQFGKPGVYNRCWVCDGRGKVLSNEGEQLLEIIKTYGDFARNGHSHYDSGHS